MANAISTGKQGWVARGWWWRGLWWEGPDQWMELYWLHSPRHKTNSPLMTTHGEGRKTRRILFTPFPQLPSLLASLYVTELFIHCPALPFLSYTHTMHMPSFPPSHNDQPKHVILSAGNLYHFHSEKATTPQPGLGVPLLICKKTALYGFCTVVRPLICTELRIHSEQRITTVYSWVITHHVYTHGKKIPLYVAFLYVNEWTVSTMRIQSMKTARHLSWLNNLFTLSGAITSQSSKLNSLSLVSCTSTSHQSHFLIGL